MIPTGATLYTFRVAYPSLLNRGRASVVKLAAYRDGALVAPSSGTYTLVRPDGTVVVDAATVTITSSVAQYTVSALVLPDTTTPLGEGWQERWSLVMPDGLTHTVSRTAALAVHNLYPAITDLDLIARYRSLSAQKTGSVTSFQGEIDEAWAILVERMVQEGRSPYTIRTPDALRAPHLELSLSLVFGAFGLNAEGEHWRKLSREHRLEYEAAYARTTVQVDPDQSGQVDGSRRSSLGGVVHLGASPSPEQYAGILGRW